MRVHGNAKLTPSGRLLLVQRIETGWKVAEAAASAGVSERTAYRWLRRYREESGAVLADRSSRPHHCPSATDRKRVRRIVRLRRRRLVAWEIAHRVGVPRSHRVSDPATRRAGAPRLPRAQGAGAQVRAPASWRASAPRYQEARAH